MHSQPVVEGSDTQNVLVFNPSQGRYTGYIRIDDASPPEHNRTCPAQVDQRRIGRCELGLAPPPHKEVDAAGWWRRAAVQGSALAQRALAEMHLEGRLGATKDEALAQTLAVLAEQQGE